MKKEFKPKITAYLRENGAIYIQATSKLGGIVGVSSEPYFEHSMANSPEELGQSVLKAKEGSLPFIERENHLDYIPPFFEWAGVSTWAQFSKKTKSISVIFTPEYIEFRSYNNKRGTWHGMPAQKVSIEVGSTPAQIGEQFLKSFENAIA